MRKQKEEEREYEQAAILYNIKDTKKQNRLNNFLKDGF